MVWFCYFHVREWNRKKIHKFEQLNASHRHSTDQRRRNERATLHTSNQPAVSATPTIKCSAMSHYINWKKVCCFLFRCCDVNCKHTHDVCSCRALRCNIDCICRWSTTTMHGPQMYDLCVYLCVFVCVIQMTTDNDKTKANKPLLADNDEIFRYFCTVAVAHLLQRIVAFLIHSLRAWRWCIHFGRAHLCIQLRLLLSNEQTHESTSIYINI